jgi:Ni/Co efflux regulator RcnB
MRRLLLSTAALILLAAPALAQPHGDRGEEHSNRVGKASVAPQVQDRAQAELRHQAQPRPQGGGRSENGRGNRAPAAQNTVQPAAPVLAAPANRGGNQRGRGDHASAPATPTTIRSPSNRGDRASSDRGNSQGRGDRGRQGGDNRSATGGDFNRPDVNRPDFNRDGRTDYRPNTRSGAGGPRHDFSGFRDYHRDFNASRRFNAPGYRRPAGWYEHRWSFGELLPSAFWARDYWLDDFQAYDLPPPPYGAVWVRVGNDALLVDEDTGEIITVAYSVFY